MLASAALVADVQPLHALHYALDHVGGLAPVVAPPYDVIDPEQRATLAARSPYNVVEIDLPRPDGDLDVYAHAARLLVSRPCQSARHTTVLDRGLSRSVDRGGTVRRRCRRLSRSRGPRPRRWRRCPGASSMLRPL